MIKRPKIAIIGAGGNVGAAVAQWAVQKELGDLVLIDLKAQAAEGRALDLTQCGPWEGFNSTSFVASADIAAIAGADVVVMTAGVPRKPGQSREELININAGIVRDICKGVKEHAPDAVLIVVSNPLDAMVFVAKQVTGFPRERVIGSAGVLDSARMELGRKYAKIIRTEKRDGATHDRSAFGFIDLTNGSIFKAASWAKPADRARGNVLDVAGRRNSYTPYGINYLR